VEAGNCPFGNFEKKRRAIMKTSTIITAVFLILVSLVHLLRLISQWKVTANNVEIPLWASAVACIATAALAVWLWQENKR
jgi:cytochrome bd-type quinol oxidase subunit 2